MSFFPARLPLTYTAVARQMSVSQAVSGIYLELPDEVISLIMSHLEVRDLVTAGMVRRQWRRISQDPEFWTQLIFDNRTISTEQFVQLCKKYPGVQRVSMAGVISLDGVAVMRALSTLTNLQHLALADYYSPELPWFGLRVRRGGPNNNNNNHNINDDNNNINNNNDNNNNNNNNNDDNDDNDDDDDDDDNDDNDNDNDDDDNDNDDNDIVMNNNEEAAFELHPCTLLPTLRSLHFTDFLLPNPASNFYIRHSNLTELVAIGCRAAQCEIECPQLRSLILSGLSADQLTLITPQLTHLDLKDVKLSENMLVRTLGLCPSITSLDVAGCSYITDLVLAALITATPLLQHLDLSRCTFSLLPAQMTLPNLTSLKLEFCDNLTNQSFQVINRIFSLQELEIDECHLLTDVKLTLRHLKSLKCTLNRALHTLTLNTPLLTHLQVAKSPALRVVSVASAQLERLSLAQLMQLRTITFDCPQLQDLELRDCDRLSSSLFSSLSSARCPSLTTLNLHQCEGLQAATLQHSALTTLSLYGCKGLTSVAFNTPNCTQVDLLECSALQRIWLSVAVTSRRGAAMDFGVFPHLQSLYLHAPALPAVDLTGCGHLRTLALDTPALKTLDCTFCSELHWENVRLAHSVRLRTLSVAYCNSPLPVLTTHLPPTNTATTASPPLPMPPRLQHHRHHHPPLVVPPGALPVVPPAGDASSSSSSSQPSSSQLRFGPAATMEDERSPRDLPSPEELWRLMTGPRKRGRRGKGRGDQRMTSLEEETEMIDLRDMLFPDLDSFDGVGVPAGGRRQQLQRMFGTRGEDDDAPSSSSTPHDSSSSTVLHPLNVRGTRLEEADERMEVVDVLVTSSSFLFQRGGLASFSALTQLDLSYTEVQDLRQVCATCPALTWLKLSACKCLRDDALEQIITGGGLLRLRDLDVSYSPLSALALQAVLHGGAQRGLRSLNTSACVNLDQTFWTQPSTSQQHRQEEREGGGGGGAGSTGQEDVIKMAEGRPLGCLRELTCVGCPQLRAVKISASSALALSHLQDLNLQLSKIFSADIQLPSLRSLNLRECVNLSSLNLECPNLRSLLVQGCSSLHHSSIQRCVSGSLDLELLDLRDLPQVPHSFTSNIRSTFKTLRRIVSNQGMNDSEEEA